MFKQLKRVHDSVAGLHIVLESTEPLLPREMGEMEAQGI